MTETSAALGRNSFLLSVQLFGPVELSGAMPPPPPPPVDSCDDSHAHNYWPLYGEMFAGPRDQNSSEETGAPLPQRSSKRVSSQLYQRQTAILLCAARSQRLLSKIGHLHDAALCYVRAARVHHDAAAGCHPRQLAKSKITVLMFAFVLVVSSHDQSGVSKSCFFCWLLTHCRLAQK